MEKIAHVCPLGGSSTSDPYNEVGTIIEIGGKRYRFVKNAESSATLPYKGVCYHDPDDAALTNVYLPYTVGTEGHNLIAGIVMAEDGLPAGSYGWVLVSGVCTATAYASGQAIAKGDILLGRQVAGVAHLYKDTAGAVKATPIVALEDLTTGVTVATDIKVFVNIV